MQAKGKANHISPSRQSRQSLAAFWDSLSREQQLQLLTFDLKLLHARAYYVSGEQAQLPLQQLSYKTLSSAYPTFCVARMLWPSEQNNSFLNAWT